MDDISHAVEPSQDVMAAGVDETSQPFVGRWNQLVSTTNWEKGRIIAQWREALVAADAPSTVHSDEAWSRRVGGVSAQHVGRLRRVSQRFGQVQQQYTGLYWSHFQAALDWEDAEMWLEGAVQNEWSVSQMRRTRWETLGAVAEQEPQDAEIIAADIDEDYVPTASDVSDQPTISTDVSDVQGPPLETPRRSGDSAGEPDGETPSSDDGAMIYAEEDERETIEFVRPFENLADLPDDLAEAFEAFKLAILRHKTEGWQQISQEDILASLVALKELVLAPSATNATF